MNNQNLFYECWGICSHIWASWKVSFTNFLNAPINSKLQHLPRAIDCRPRPGWGGEFEPSSQRTTRVLSFGMKVFQGYEHTFVSEWLKRKGPQGLGFKAW